MTATISGADYETIHAESFDVLVDTNRRRGPVIGIMVNPSGRDAFILPLAYESAKELSEEILNILRVAAPDLFGRQTT